MTTQLLRRFWANDSGFVLSAELALVASLLAIGMTVGLASLRNQMVQELDDVGEAIGSVDQTYAYSGLGKVGVGFVAGSSFADQVNFRQEPGQPPGTELAGFRSAPTSIIQAADTR